ncbi:hypothetical protein ACFLZC_00855 [Patescibacteria group bacterium]
MLNKLHMYVFRNYCLTGKYVGPVFHIDAVLIFSMSAVKHFRRGNIKMVKIHLFSAMKHIVQAYRMIII